MTTTSEEHCGHEERFHAPLACALCNKDDVTFGWDLQLHEIKFSALRLFAVQWEKWRNRPWWQRLVCDKCRLGAC